MTSDQAIKTLTLSAQSLGYDEGKRIGHANGLLDAIQMLGDYRRDNKKLTQAQKKALSQAYDIIREKFDEDHPEFAS
jgi:hypothetical protein